MSKKLITILLASATAVATATVVATILYKKKSRQIYYELADDSTSNYKPEKDHTANAIKYAGHDKTDIDE